jgi:hypothetical protein
MPLTCNIDSRGKRARFLYGLIILVLAVVASAWAWHASGWGWWVVAGLLAGMGGFAIFEARAGWCALRAMGFKTRI